MNQPCIRAFKSLAEMARYARTRRETLPLFNKNNSESGRWVGRRFKSWKECENAHFVEPWEEGAGIIAEMKSELEGLLPKPLSIKRKLRIDETEGEEIDLDRLRLGLPFWRKVGREKGRAKGKIVQLVYNIGANCSFDTKSMLWRGAVCFVLADLLEEAGYRVEIMACSVGVGRYKEGPFRDVLHTAIIKPSYTPLDIPMLAAGIAGWSFRTLWFRGFGRENCTLNEGIGASYETMCWVAPFITQKEWDQAGIDEKAWIIADCFDKENAFGVLKQVLSKYITD